VGAGNGIAYMFDGNISFVMMETGSFGINTSAPTQALDVNGSGNFSGPNAQVWVNNSLVCTAANGLCGWLSTPNVVNLANNTNLSVDNSVLFVDTTNNIVGMGQTQFQTTYGLYARLYLNTTQHTYVNLNANASRSSGISFSENGVDKWAITSRGTYDTPNNRLSIFNASSVEAVTIVPNGNVGIGFNNPGDKLAVNGSMRLGDNPTLNTTTGNLTITSQGGYVIIQIG
jgi:hypothetical protein